jgi:hypothetical protein
LLKEGRDITKKTDLTTDNHSDASKQVKAVHHFGDGPTEERITTSVDGTMMPKESTNHDESAGIITAMVYKESIDTQVGIGLKGNANKNLYISSIADGGLFASTDLKTGQDLLTINNIDCQNMSSTEAIKLIRSTKGNLTITATDEASFISAPTGRSRRQYCSSKQKHPNQLHPQLIRTKSLVACLLHLNYLQSSPLFQHQPWRLRRNIIMAQEVERQKRLNSTRDW